MISDEGKDAVDEPNWELTIKAQTSPYHEMVSREKEPENGNQKPASGDVFIQPEVVLRSPGKSQSNGNSKIDAIDVKANPEPVKNSPSVSFDNHIHMFDAYFPSINVYDDDRSHPSSPLNDHLPKLKWPVPFLFTHLDQFRFKNSNNLSSKL